MRFRLSFVPCPIVPGKNYQQRPGPQGKVHQRNRLPIRGSCGEGTHSLPASVSACFVPKVSHSSRKWDSLVGHFSVVTVGLNPVCPAVPLYIENSLIVPSWDGEKSGGKPALLTALGCGGPLRSRRITDGGGGTHPPTQVVLTCFP